MENFDIIRKEGRLLIEYVRGSHLYGLNTNNSDIDTGGVFMCTRRELLGCQIYQTQVTDNRHDNTWYEVGELIRLLLKSNPTVMECLFIPEGKIISEVHPIMQALINNRGVFLTQECFNPFFGYAKSQIEKARGLNKKIVNPINERLTPFDFTYTFEKQGSKKIKDWLEDRGLDKDYCGLVHIPNMHDTYGVYYDWGRWFKDNNTNSSLNMEGSRLIPFIRKTYDFYNMGTWIKEHSTVYNYRGMCLEDATELRCSSVAKGEKPICYIVYNESGYKDHCRKYKEYQEWVSERNPVRYESNLGKSYDGKNMSHCFRLMHMAEEIANGEGVNLVREKDKQFLLDVRNHKYEYDELMELLEEEKEKMNKAMENSTIPKHIDRDFVNEMMIGIREKQLKELEK